MSQSIRSRWTTLVFRSSLVAITLLILSASPGCRSGCGDTDRQEPAPRSDVPPTVDAAPARAIDLNALERVHTRLEASVKSMKQMTIEAEKYPEQMATHARALRKKAVFVRVPMAPETEELKRLVAEHAGLHGLKVLNVQAASELQKTARKLPKNFERDGPYPYTQDDLLETQSLTITMGPADKTSVAKFLETLNDKSRRAVRVHKVLWNEQEVGVRAQTFHFRAVKPPTRRYLAPTSARQFDEAGFPSVGPECGSNAACGNLNRKIQALQQEATQHHSVVERSILLRAEVELWIARDRAFDSLIELVTNTDYTTLLP